MPNQDETNELLRQILKVSALQVALNAESVTEGARALKLAGLDNKQLPKFSTRLRPLFEPLLQICVPK
jgi:hypothetical protein